MRPFVATLALAVAAGAGCGGSTGGALLSFSAVASGPADAPGGPLAFTSGFGAQVTLTRARLHLAAVYLNQSVPPSGGTATPCISPGVYVGQVFGPLDLDLLSAAPQQFPTRGEGTETAASSAEVWLTGGDIDAADDPTVILELSGTAVQAGQTFPFTASVTIGANRALPSQNPARPGANPICHQRIVSPILVDLTPTPGGLLVLQIDPRAMLDGVDFTGLTPAGSSPPLYQIPDASAGAGGDLFKGLFASWGVYSFSWRAQP